MTDLDLALTYVSRPQRLWLADLFALDAALGQVVRTTREPMVGRIRLAWWRERLEEIDQGLVPAEPQLEATAALIAATPLTGAMLAELADCWAPLLDNFPWGADAVEGVVERGCLLFDHAATLLGAKEPRLAAVAGSLWSLVDVAKHCSDDDSREALIEAARGIALTGTVDAAGRPLTMLGLLARRDLERWPAIEPEATPGRAWAMIAHRLTGKL